MRHRFKRRLAIMVAAFGTAALVTPLSQAQDGLAEPGTLRVAPPTSEPPTSEPPTPLDEPIRPVDSREPPIGIPELRSQPPTSRPSLDPTRDDRDAELTRLFEGDFEIETTEDIPGRLEIRVRQSRQIHLIEQIDGNSYPRMRTVVHFETQAVDPKSKDLSPEQRLGVIVALQEREMQERHKQLANAKDDAARKAALDSLAELYAERFDIDTRYQDYMVRKIERRAAKLRADLDAREKASKEWVDAMITLTKMKASGIETMPALVPAEVLPTNGTVNSLAAPSTIGPNGWSDKMDSRGGIDNGRTGQTLRTPQFLGDGVQNYPPERRQNLPNASPNQQLPFNLQR